MLIEQIIIGKLNKEFNPTILKIKNESFMHNVPMDSETHFKIIIVSDKFKNIPDIERHKLIYKILSIEMNKIHALSIYAFDIDQYNNKPIIIDSPNCANT